MKGKRRGFGLFSWLITCVCIAAVLSLALPHIYDLRISIISSKDAQAIEQLAVDLGKYFYANNQISADLHKVTKVPISPGYSRNEWIFDVKNQPCLSVYILQDKFGQNNGSVVFKSHAQNNRSACGQLLDSQPARAALSGTYTCAQKFYLNSPNYEANERADIDLQAQLLGADVSGCTQLGAEEQGVERPVLEQKFDLIKNPITAISY